MSLSKEFWRKKGDEIKFETKWFQNAQNGALENVFFGIHEMHT